MIIWLASYPRSGNTLLRTILQQCMSLGSYNHEVSKNLNEIHSLKDVDKWVGNLPMPSQWDEFYEFTSQSKEIVFIKTHLPPKDGQPAIYIVRDGRQAIASYLEYYRQYNPDSNITLQKLILGTEIYLGWSEHINAWNIFERPNTLILRYEELVNVKEDVLNKIAKFISFNGDIKEWQNPFDLLQQKKPEFFRKGKIDWENNQEWTLWINQLFYFNHGEMMSKLNYSSIREVKKYIDSIPSEVVGFINLARELELDRRKFEKECWARLDVINDLKNECDNRLVLINKLNSDLKECLINQS